MQERDHQILMEFADRVRSRYSSARLWAFGSRALGLAQKDSDLDVCVVLDDLDASIRETISNLAWEVGFEHDVLIATVVFANDMFEHGPPSASPLVRAILEDGVAA